MISTSLGYLEAIFGWLLAASWQAAVLALLVLLVQTLLRNRLNPRWRYALWLLVLARLLLPALPESTLSLFQFAPPPPPALIAPVTTSLFVETPPSVPAILLSATAPLPEPTHPFSLYSLLALIWLTGAVCLFVLTWQVNRRFARQVAASPEITDPDLRALFAQTQAELNLRRTIRLIESPHVQSPAIMGLFSPTLLLPLNVRAEFDRTELRLIFLHELAHLKRGDVIAQGLIAFLQILHWFNPVLWFAFHRMRADREPATDALVLSRAGESEKERYGLMLIKLLENFNQRHSLPTLVGILEDKDQFKRRFTLIARFTRGAYGWSLLGVLLIALLSAACLTAKETEPSKPFVKKDQTDAPPIYVRFDKISSDFFGPVELNQTTTDNSYVPGTDYLLSVQCRSINQDQATLVFSRSWGTGTITLDQPKFFPPVEVQIPLGKIHTFRIFDSIDVTTSPNPPKPKDSEPLVFVSPITNAICNGDANLVKQLLDQGAMVTPLDMGNALNLGTPAMAKMLWDHSPHLCPELVYAISQNESLDQLKVLLASGAPTAHPYVNITPLSMAARRGNIEVAQWLLDHGAAINDGLASPGTALNNAVHAQDIPTAKFLFKNGAKANAWTLDQAVAWSDFSNTDSAQKTLALVKWLLLQAKALQPLSIDNKVGLLVQAGEKGSPDLLQIYLDAGIDPLAKRIDGKTALNLLEEDYSQHDRDPSKTIIKPVLDLLQRTQADAAVPTNEDETLTVRTFLVPSGFFKTPPNPSTTTVDVKPELTNKGIVFPSGSRVTFLPGSGKLVMRNTPTQLDKTGALFPAIPDSAPASSWNPADLALLAKNDEPSAKLDSPGHLISPEGTLELSPDVEKTLSVGNPKEPVTFRIENDQLVLTRKSPQGSIHLPITHNGWIIYANATSTLWFYDGWGQIQSIQLKPDGFHSSSLSSQQPDLWPLAPPLFLAAIEKARLDRAAAQTNSAGPAEPSIPYNSLTMLQKENTQAELDKLGTDYDMDMAEALIEGRNDIIKRQYARGNSHCSALTYAISQGASVAEVQAMLKNGTSIQVEKDEVLSPLCMAVIKGDLPLVTLLIEHGADPQWRGQGNIIDLDAMSLALSNPDIVAYLLDHGVRAEFKDLQFAVVGLDPDRSTPLRAKEKETVRLLLDHGALDQQPPLPSVTKGDLLRIACLNARDIEVVKWLLAHGCDPDQRDLLKKKTVLEWVRDASEGKNNWPIYPEFKPILALLEAAGKTTSTDTGKTSSLLEIDDTGTNASSPSPAQAEFQRKASAIMVNIDFGRKSIIDVLKSVQADAARQGFIFSLDLSKLDPGTPPLIYNYGHSASVDNALQIIGDDVGLKVETLPNGPGYRISYDELKHKAQQTYIDVDFKNVDAITALKTVQSEAAKQGFVFNLDLTAVNELPDLPLTAKGADLTVAETITAICWRANLSALPQENSRSYRIVVKDPFITGGSEPGQLITPEGTFAIPSGSLQTFNLGNPKEPVQFRYDKGVLSMVRRPLFGNLDLHIGHKGWKVYLDSSETVWAYNGNGHINRLQFHSREFAQEIVEYADYSPLDKTLWAQAPGRFLALIGKNRAGQDVSPHSPTPEEADPDSALISAVKTNDVMTLVALLRGGVIYDAPSHPSAPTPLFLTNNHTVATLLIARGIDVHTRNDLGMTALHQVCSTRDPEAAETALVLLQHGANPNATDNQGRTPLMIAGNGPCAEPLLEHGAKR